MRPSSVVAISFLWLSNVVLAHGGFVENVLFTAKHGNKPLRCSQSCRLYAKEQTKKASMPVKVIANVERSMSVKRFTGEVQADISSWKTNYSFPRLDRYSSPDDLLENVMPILMDKSYSSSPLAGKNAAYVLNKIRGANATSDSFWSMRASLVQVVRQHARELPLKSLALALNAVKENLTQADMDLFKTACVAATDNLRELMDEEASSQSIAMMLNSLARSSCSSEAFASAFFQQVAEEMMRENRIAVRDSQALATILNSFASMSIWPRDLFRSLGEDARSIQPQGHSLQSIAMILNSYSRFLERNEELSAWDVKKCDLLFFDSMAESTLQLLKRLREPPRDAVRSIALIVNAFSKVGVVRKDLYLAVVEVLKRGNSAPSRKKALGHALVVRGALVYDSQAVANILNAFARANVKHPWLFEEFADILTQMQYSSFTSQHIATILNAYARTGVKSREVLEHMSVVLRYWKRFGKLTPSRFSPQSAALILNAYSREGVEDIALFASLAVVLQQHFESEMSNAGGGAEGAISSQTVSNIVNACANANFESVDLIRLLTNVVMRFQPQDTSLQHISCIANGMVRLGNKDSALLSHLGKLAMVQPSEASALPLALIANAFAKAELKDSTLFRWISQQAMLLPPPAFSSQTIAMLANAFAKNGERDHALFRRMCFLCMEIPDQDFDAQSIANIVNAFAKNTQAWTRYADAAPAAYTSLKTLFRRLARIVTGLSEQQFSAQGVALIVNAFAKLGMQDSCMFAHLSRVAQQMGQRNFEIPCSPQDVVNIVNAFAKAHVHDAELFGHMSLLLQAMSAHQFEASKIGILLNAYAQLRIRDLPLLRRLSKVAMDMSPSAFDAHAIANIFHALAVLNVEDSELLGHVATTLLRSRQTMMQAKDFNAQALSNIAWSIAVLKISDPTLNRWICSSCLSQISSMDGNALSQLHQYILAIEVEGLVPKKELPELDSLLQHRKRIEQAWHATQRALLSSSKLAGMQGTMTLTDKGAAATSDVLLPDAMSGLQRNVADTLRVVWKELQEQRVVDQSWTLEEETIERVTSYSLDISIAAASFAIEVDGPSHFARGSKIPLGRTLMKRRQLQAIGYKLFSMPYWEWHSGLSNEQKKSKLRTIIDKHVLGVEDKYKDTDNGNDMDIHVDSTRSYLGPSMKLDELAGGGRKEDGNVVVSEGALLPKPRRIGSHKSVLT